LWRSVIEDRLWNEVIIANWDYTPNQQEHFERIIDIVGHTDRQLACPGISNWNRLYPNFDDAIANLEGFLDAARKKGVMGFAITAWGDDGSECLFSFLDPLILIGMEAAESGSTSKWTEKWIRIAGEPREVVQARMVLGRREVADNLKKSTLQTRSHTKPERPPDRPPRDNREDPPPRRPALYQGVCPRSFKNAGGGSPE